MSTQPSSSTCRADRRRRARRAGLTLLVAALLELACGVKSVGGGQTHFGRARLLDHACSLGQCQLDGSAAQTAGITDDSVAISVGPGAGSATIPLDHGFPFDEVEILARVEGVVSFSHDPTSCPDCPPTLARNTESFEWQPVPAGVASTGGLATLRVRVDDEQSLIEILDVRLVDRPQDKGCSVAGFR